MLTLIWLVAGGLAVSVALAVFLVVSVFAPKSRPARWFVDRPDHTPEWLPRSDPRRVQAEQARADYLAMRRS